MNAPRTHQVVKLTPSYDAVEDRIRLGTEAKDGTVVTFWVTQRLLHGVVMTLARLLDEDVKRSTAAQAAPQLQSLEQSAAQAQHRASPPVSTAQAIEGGLVIKIDLTRRSDGGYILAIFGRAEHVARIGLTATETRQMLGVFARMCKTANWSTAGWPRWLVAADAQASAVQAERGALH
jgi:hypothetical protein